MLNVFVWHVSDLPCGVVHVLVFLVVRLCRVMCLRVVCVVLCDVV